MTNPQRAEDERATALLALAKRCEREEPSRALDKDIANAVFELEWRLYAQGKRIRTLWAYPRGSNRAMFYSDKGVPEFTASIDDATTLVPEGWTPYLALRWEGDGEVYIHEWRTPCRRIPEAGIIRGNNYALALCAAALKARAAMATDQGAVRTSGAGGDGTSKLPPL